MDLDALADQMQIVTGLRRYAYAIDDRDFDTVRSLFTEDATLDYRASSGPIGTVEMVVDWIEQGLGMVGPTQHLLSNEVVDVSGNQAASRCYMLNPLLSTEDPPSHVLLLGGEYRDQWRRTRDGWRIANRIHVVTWTRSMPS